MTGEQGRKFMMVAEHRRSATHWTLRDWSRFTGGGEQTRLLTLADGPSSYDAEAHTVIATISRGSPVKRSYGTEVLKISPDAVILTRIKNGGVPLLDSHNQYALDAALGRITEA